MTQTLLQLTQNIVQRLPLSVIPTQVVNSTDPQTQQLLSIIQDVGDDIMSRHEWNNLYSTFSWSIVTTQQEEPFPDDWKTWLTTSSVWVSSSLLIPLSGPVLNADIWHRLITMPGTWFPGYWRYANNEVQTIGLNTGVTATCEYISRAWILAADGTTRLTEFEADTDTMLLPDRLIRLGAIWQWKQSKGLDYAQDFDTFQAEFERDVSADRSPKPLNMQKLVRPDAPPYAWPGMITPA